MAPVPDVATDQQNPAAASPIPAPNTPDIPVSGPYLSPTGPAPNPQPPPPSRESFKEGFSRGAGTQYRTNDEGEIENAAPARKPTAGGILGSVLSGALVGATRGMAAQTPEGARGKGAAFSAGAAAAQKGALEADARAREIAQRNFENKQEATKTKLQANMWNMQTLTLAHKMANDDAEFHTILEGHGLDNQEKRDRLRVLDNQQAQNDADLIQAIQTNGIQPVVTATQKPQNGKSAGQVLLPHAASMAAGSTLLLHNGGKGQEANGVKGFATADLDKPFSISDNQPYLVPHYTGSVSDGTYVDQKTGQVVSKGGLIASYTAVQPDGKTTWRQIGQQLKSANMQLQTAQEKIAKTHEDEQKQAETEKDKAQAKEAQAGAKLKNVQAKNLASGGAKLDDGSWNPASVPVSMVEGNMDPSQLSKRSADYNQKLQAANQYSLEKYGKPFDIAQASIDYKFASAPQTQNTLKYLNSVIPNMADLTRQSNALGRTQFPALNRAELWAKLNAGSPQVAAFDATITEVSDQIAKILQGGGTGNGTSDAKLKQAQELFNQGFSAEQVRGITDELSKLLDTRRSALIGDNRYLQKQFGLQPNQVPSGKTAVYNKQTGALAGYADDANGTNLHRF
jgi:hypothetical protein